MVKLIYRYFIANKKKKIYKTLKKSKMLISNKIIIMSLLDSGVLDNIINKINESNIQIISPMIKKGYFTGYEQFISILDKFICYTLDIICNPELVEIILANNKNSKEFLLSNKYVNDVENIEYYKYNFNYLIVKVFFNNIIKVKNDLFEELKELKLEIVKIDLNNKDDVKKLVDIIREIILVNKNDYKILHLFTNISEEKKQIYIDWYKILLHKYITNKEFINSYRKLQKNNF